MSIRLGSQGVLPAFKGFKHADKVNHALYGGAIALSAGYVSSKFFGFDSATIPLAAAALFAVGKEIYDETVRHRKWEFLDIIATITPALLYALIK